MMRGGVGRGGCIYREEWPMQKMAPVLVLEFASNQNLGFTWGRFYYYSV
jgi:hypothetical protein